MSSWAYYLHQEHVDADGDGAQMFYASTLGAAGPTPAGTAYIPCLEIDDIGILEQAILDGRSIKEPPPPADVAVTLRRRRSGRDRLAALDDRILSGRPATLFGTGQGADGTVYTLAAPLVFAAGGVVQESRGLDRIRLTIRPQKNLFERVVPGPGATLLGYRDGLLFNGSTHEAASTYTTVPERITLGARVLTPHHWAVGAGVFQTIWGHGSIQVGYKLTNGYKLTLVTRHASSAVSGLHETVGPEFVPREDFHWITFRINWLSPLPGVLVSFGLDSEFTEVLNPNGFHTFAGEVWKVGRYRTTSDTLDTLVGALTLWEEWLTDDEILEMQSARLQGDETNLRIFYPGAVVGGLLIDKAEVNATPLNATVTGAVATSLLEGPENLTGTQLPLVVGEGRNVTAVPVDPARNFFRVTGSPATSVSGVWDRGLTYTIERHHQSVKSFLLTATTGTGMAAVCPWLGGLIRVHNVVDGAVIAADVAGGSGWDMSVQSEFYSSGNPVLSFPTAFNGVVETGFALELWWMFHGEPTVSSFVAFQSENIRITYVPAEKKLLIKVFLTGAAELTLGVKDVFPGEPQAIRVDAQNNFGGGSTAHLTSWGRAVESSGDPSEALITGGSSAPYLVLGVEAGVHVSALPMRVWTTPAQTAAQAEAEHRKYMWTHPDPGAETLAGMWTRHYGTLATIPDEGGLVGNATISNAKTYGHYGPGVCWGQRLAAAHYLLQVHGGLAPTSITDAASAWGMTPGVLAWFATSRVAVPAAVSDILRGGGGYVLALGDGTMALGQIVEPTAANAEGVLEAEIKEIGDRNVDALPPSIVRALWGRIGDVVTNPLDGADEERRALMAKPVREIPYPIRGNAKRYDDLPAPLGRALEIDTHFRSRAAALAEAKRVAVVWGAERPEFSVKLRGGHRDVLAGSVWGFVDPHSGVTTYAVLIWRQSREDAEEWRAR